MLANGTNDADLGPANEHQVERMGEVIGVAVVPALVLAASTYNKAWLMKQVTANHRIRQSCKLASKKGGGGGHQRVEQP